MLRTRTTILRCGVLLFASALCGVPALAADDQERKRERTRYELAPPGRCAGEELELPPVSAAPDEVEKRSLGAARNRMSPTDVAAALPGPSLAPPERFAFDGPGACDDPGSGCLGTIQAVPSAAPPAPEPTPNRLPPFGFGTGPAGGGGG